MVRNHLNEFYQTTTREHRRGQLLGLGALCLMLLLLAAAIWMLQRM